MARKVSILLGLAMFFLIAFKLPAQTLNKPASEIELPNTKGTNLKLSSLKGKYVLLSFWSTWCVACKVIKNPEYVRLWAKYKDYSFEKASEFTIFSVALDEDIAKWKQTIASDGLNWPYHVVDKESYYSSLWFEYNLPHIPYNYLIDEKGVVVGVNLSFAEIDKFLDSRKKSKKPNSNPDDSSTKPNSGNTGSGSGTGGNNNNNNNNQTKPNTPQQQQITVYKIQLGASGNPNLAAFSNLTDLGKLTTEAVEGKNLKRILLGTYTEATVDAKLAIVKQRGYASVIKVARKENVDVSTTPPADGGKTTTPNSPTQGQTTESKVLRKVFKIQLGVFAKPDLSKFSTLANIGKFDTEEAPNGAKRVLLGSFEKKNDAELALNQVKSKGFQGFTVARDEYELITAFAPTQFGQRYELAKPDAPDIINVRDLEFPEVKASMVGKIAPDIKLPDVNGNTQVLSATRKKLTLIYFWASWSGPSRNNHEDLNKIYKKYNKKGLEIFGVSLDKDPKRAAAAIEKDKLSWSINANDAEAMKSKLLDKYNVEYLPALFLIDQDGKIVGENLTFEQLDAEIDVRIGE